jgi:hypothetical protein
MNLLGVLALVRGASKSATCRDVKIASDMLKLAEHIVDGK